MNGFATLSFSPFEIFGVALALQWLGAWLGYVARKRGPPVGEPEHEDFTAILGATMTLLALIIGFSFSMAATRYDQRKDLEEAEANAIGTEFVRADLLPTDARAQVRRLLADYARERILFYETTDARQLKQVDSETDRLQGQLWTAVATHATAQPTPVAALVASGMNDVLNSQGYTLAAWRNHIPPGAWALMLVVAFAGNAVFGYMAKRKRALILLILPVIVSVPFFLIADIDSPRRGVIRVIPVNLITVAQSLRP